MSTWHVTVSRNQCIHIPPIAAPPFALGPCTSHKATAQPCQARQPQGRSGYGDECYGCKSRKNVSLHLYLFFILPNPLSKLRYDVSRSCPSTPISYLWTINSPSIVQMAYKFGCTVSHAKTCLHHGLPLFGLNFKKKT